MAEKTQEFAGMERPKIREIEDAAEEYVKARDRRMACTEKECAAKLALLQTCQEHEKELSKDGDGNRVYRYDDEIVILKPGKVGVQVKRAGSEDPDED